jgi:hypothetical protein
MTIMSDQKRPVVEPHAPRSRSAATQRELGATLRHWGSRAVAVVRKREGHPAPRKNLNLVLREWHKRAGIAVFIFMGWLGVSGIFLNESPDLGLDTARVSWGWLNALYGLRAEPPRTGFSASGHWLAVTTDATLIDGKPLATPVVSPLGLASGNSAGKSLLFAATPDSLVLLTPSGERVDELRAPTLPVMAIRRVGMVSAHPGTIAVQDLDAYQSSDGGETWTPVAPGDVRWSQPQPLPEVERAKLVPYSRPSVIVEQVLIDAHSGRLFGRYGTYVIDAVGFIALWLATSGVWIWWRSNRRRQTGRATASLPLGQPVRRDAGV